MSQNWPTEPGAQGMWAWVTQGYREETWAGDTDVGAACQPRVAGAHGGAGALWTAHAPQGHIREHGEARPVW